VWSTGDENFHNGQVTLLTALTDAVQEAAAEIGIRKLRLSLRPEASPMDEGTGLLVCLHVLALHLLGSPENQTNHCRYLEHVRPAMGGGKWRFSVTLTPTHGLAPLLPALRRAPRDPSLSVKAMKVYHILP
jgi:hypothetical protein